MSNGARRPLRFGWAAMAAAAVGVGLAHLSRIQSPLAGTIGLTAFSSESARSTPHTEAELVLVYVGRSDCRWCKDPTVRLALRKAEKSLGTDTAGPFVLRTRGVAVDESSAEGLKHLASLTRFDEVSAGMGWRNASVERVILGDFAGPAATPQLLVLWRQVTYAHGKRRGVPIISNEAVAARKVGVMEIRKWMEQGFPIASLASTDSQPVTTK